MIEEAPKVLEAHRYAEAVQRFLQALEGDPQNAEIHRGLAKAYHNLKKYTEAERHAKIAIELEPAVVDPYLTLFLVRYKQDANPQACYALAEQAYAVAPEDVHAIHCMGLANLLMKKPKEGVEFLERAVALTPDDYPLHYALWLGYDQLKMGEELLREAKEMYRLHPSILSRYQVFVSFLNSNRRAAKIVKVLVYLALVAFLPASFLGALMLSTPWLLVFPSLLLIGMLFGGIIYIKYGSKFIGIVDIIFALTFLTLLGLLAYHMIYS